MQQVSSRAPRIASCPAPFLVPSARSRLLSSYGNRAGWPSSPFRVSVSRQFRAT